MPRALCNKRVLGSDVPPTGEMFNGASLRIYSLAAAFHFGGSEAAGRQGPQRVGKRLILTVSGRPPSDVHGA